MTHKIVVDLGFGDAGKGTVVDHLCATQDIKCVVRFSGGAQAAHNVITPDGWHHTFAQFGSGTFHGVPTYLSRFMMVNPLNMVREADHIMGYTGRDPFRSTFIDGDALLTTPYHVAANRAREIARGSDRHGSCGQGIGETTSYAIDFEDEAPLIRDLEDPGLLKWKLRLLRLRLAEEVGRLDAPNVDYLVKAYMRLVDDRKPIITGPHVLAHFLSMGDVVFEGSQGVLLDEWYGFHPHTTWSTTTPENARILLEDAGGYDATVIGVTRSYMTRHGAGPFPSEVPMNAAEAFAFDWADEKHNGTGTYQGAWRIGHLDLVLLEYANAVCGGIDELAVTHLDRAGGPIVSSYAGFDPIRPKIRKTDLREQERLTEYLFSVGQESLRFEPAPTAEQVVSVIQRRLDAPVTLTSYGPTWMDKKVREGRLDTRV